MISLNVENATGYAIGEYNDSFGSKTLLGESTYRYMYRKQWYLVDALARWVQAFVISSSIKADLVIPVPSSRVLSDYDPASLLIDWVSQLTNIPRAIGLLNRYGLISEYSQRSSDDNTRGGFTILSNDAIKGKNILLIDGIYCSGASANMATKALLKAGAKSVTFLALTRINRNSVDAYGFGDQGEQGNN